MEIGSHAHTIDVINQFSLRMKPEPKLIANNQLEKDNQLITSINLLIFIADDDNFSISSSSSTNEKMKTGSVRSNNNNTNTLNNNNKIYADKFEVIENISNNNLNSNPPPSIDLLSYSNNNNVYADIVDLDDTETLSLMYSQNVNAQQQFDRGPHDRTLSNNSTKKPYDEQSFYLANSSSRSFGS